MTTNSNPNDIIAGGKPNREEQTQVATKQASLSEPNANAKPTYGSNVGRAINTGNFAASLGKVALNALDVWNELDDGPDIGDYIKNREELRQAVESGAITPAMASARRRQMRNNAHSAFSENPYAMKKLYEYEKSTVGTSDDRITNYERKAETIADTYFKLTGTLIDVYNTDQVMEAEVKIQDIVAKENKLKLLQYKIGMAKGNSEMADHTVNENIIELNKGLSEKGFALLDRFTNKVKNGGNITNEELMQARSELNEYRHLFSQASQGRNVPALRHAMDQLDRYDTMLKNISNMPAENQKRELEAFTVNFSAGLIKPESEGGLPDKIKNSVIANPYVSNADKRLAFMYLSKNFNSLTPKQKEDVNRTLSTSISSEGDPDLFKDYTMYSLSMNGFHPAGVHYIARAAEKNPKMAIEGFRNFSPDERRGFIEQVEMTYKNVGNELVRMQNKLSGTYEGKGINELVDIVPSSNGFIVKPKKEIAPDHTLKLYCNNLQSNINNKLWLYGLHSAAAGGRNLTSMVEIMKSKEMINDMLKELRAFGDVQGWKQQQEETQQ